MGRGAAPILQQYYGSLFPKRVSDGIAQVAADDLTRPHVPRHTHIDDLGGGRDVCSPSELRATAFHLSVRGHTRRM